MVARAANFARPLASVHALTSERPLGYPRAVANHFSAEIEARIGQFVADLSVLVRKAAIASVAEALGSEAASSPPRRGPGRPRKSVAAPTASTTPASNGSGALRLPRLKKGQKRDPKDLEKIVAAVGAHVKDHPGEGVEHIAKHLGVATKEITLPIAKLLEQKAIKKKGVKRATRYFPS
jgi:hypothetical protein